MYMSTPHTYFLESLSKLSLDSTMKSAIAKFIEFVLKLTIQKTMI